MENKKEEKLEQENKINLDLLNHIEELSSKINSIMAQRTKSIFSRYPVTFALLLLTAVIAISEGLKDIIKSIPFLADYPMRLLAIGLFILIITGTLYKKLDK